MIVKQALYIIHFELLLVITCDNMNNKGSNAIAPAILLISFILIGSTVSSMLLNSPKNIKEENIQDMVDTVVREISIYLTIEDVYGEYSFIDCKHQIEKIVIEITPLLPVELDISDIIIKLNNGEDIKNLYFNKNSDYVESYSIFKHPLWKDTSISEYSVLVLQDRDHSIIKHNTINDNTDSMYIIFKLPYRMMMKKDDCMSISFSISNGISRTIEIKAPLPMKSIVNLW